jgi:antitoxin (DNA-binding transcriptional repressor) of toxin-antitoxin stability system
MKIENIHAVKTRFSRYVKELPKTGSVVITENGRPCATLMAVTEDTDLEVLALTQNKRFWKLIDRGIARGQQEGFTELAKLSVQRHLLSAPAPSRAIRSRSASLPTGLMSRNPRA